MTEENSLTLTMRPDKVDINLRMQPGKAKQFVKGLAAGVNETLRNIAEHAEVSQDLVKLMFALELATVDGGYEVAEKEEKEATQ